MCEHGLNNGDVLRVRVAKAPNLLHHYGIVICYAGRALVAHCPAGSTPVLESFADFMQGREWEVNFGRQTDAGPVQLIERFNQLAQREYDLAAFNCEDFVNRMSGTSYMAGKGFIWAAFALTVALLLFLID
jgi:hypothetical protein